MSEVLTSPDTSQFNLDFTPATDLASYPVEAPLDPRDVDMQGLEELAAAFQLALQGPDPDKDIYDIRRRATCQGSKLTQTVARLALWEAQRKLALRNNKHV